MHRKFLVVMAFLLITGFAHSQTSKLINLEKAIDIALERNLSTLQAKNNVESQMSSRQPAIGGLLPSLSASGGFQRNQYWRPPTGSTQQYIPGIGIIDVPGSSGYSAASSYTSSISSNVTLFNGFANIANLNRADANIRSAEYSYNRVKESTIYQTHQLFLNVVRTYELLKVNEENLKRSRRQLERIEETNKVGSASLADVYRQRVTTGNDELALINAQNNYEKSKADLLLFLAIDDHIGYDFDISGVPTDIDTVEFDIVNKQYSNFDELLKQATESRSDYLASIQNLNASSSNLTVAQSGLYPTVYGNASYGMNNKEFSKISDNKSLTLGLGVSLSIFNGFQTQNAIEQAKISKKNSENQLNQTGRQIAVDIQKARLDLEAVEKQIKVTQASVFSAEMDRKIAEEKYNLGAGTLLDLLIANANYTNAQSNKVNAVIGYLLAKKQMEFVLGTISN